MSNPCGSIETSIKSLQAQAESLHKELSAASPQEKPAIVAEIKALNQRIRAERQRLAACVKAQIEKQPLVPVTIAVSGLRCHVETDEVGADEPYVLVTAADISGLIPSVEMVQYGPFADVDAGENKSTFVPTGGAMDQPLDMLHLLRRPFWNVDGRPKLISSPDQVIFIAAMMERDDGSPTAARTLAKIAATASLASSMSLSRAQRVAKLIADLRGALATPTGAPNFDDRIGSPQELSITIGTLKEAGVFGSVTRSLSFKGDGGQYTLSFEIKKG